MNRTIIRTIIAATLLIAASAASAQCTMKNTAFKSGESLTYNLYFNWKFVWYKVGTASLSTTERKYQGHEAYRTSLITRSNGRLDKYFIMRDTLLTYISKQLVPLYYRKGAHEGKRYTVDEVWYSYHDNRCKVRMKRLHNDKSITHNEKTSNECIFDMLSLFLRSRSLNPKGWQRGHQIKVEVAGGRDISPGLLTYKGIENIKADDGKKYRCLKLEYAEWNSKKKKYEKLSSFFVTDDLNHIPIRLDFNLRFGSAKAYLTSMKGIRN